MMEMVFLNTYGSPWLRSLVGFGTQQAPSRHIERDLLRETTMARLRLELEHRFEEGHIEDAVMRALIYIRLPERAVDERGFAMLKLIRDTRPTYQRISLAQFKQIVKRQYLLLCLNEQKALDTLPKLLPSDQSERRWAVDAVRRVLSATGSLSGEGQRRLARIEELFGAQASAPQEERANA
jgi:hypothetical protein